MFRKTKTAFEAGYKAGFEHGFNDALEMVKQIIRNKSTETREQGDGMQWEDMRNGKVYPETETD